VQLNLQGMLPGLDHLDLLCRAAQCHQKKKREMMKMLMRTPMMSQASMRIAHQSLADDHAFLDFNVRLGEVREREEEWGVYRSRREKARD
jgi:hypothetical protein